MRLDAFGCEGPVPRPLSKETGMYEQALDETLKNLMPKLAAEMAEYGRIWDGENWVLVYPRRNALVSYLLRNQPDVLDAWERAGAEIAIEHPQP